MIDTSLMYSIDKNNYAPIIIERREKYESHDVLHPCFLSVSYTFTN